MSNGTPTTAAFFRALDDSALDVYETRFLMRVWRRGTCWEKLQSIADTTGMSVGKASQVRRNLLDNGWLIEVIDNGQVAYQVSIPTVEEVQEVKPIVVDVQEVKSIVAEFHVVEPDFHEVKPDFHEVSALPINRQIEDIPINHLRAHGEGSSDDGDREALQRAWEAIVDLIEFWEALTKRKRPPQDSNDFIDLWLKPFNEIWIACGRSVDAAKAKIQAVRNDMLAQGLTIFNPAKLLSHVQTMIDRELLPLTTRMNGNGHTNLRNDPDAREARNRAVLEKVSNELSTGEWTPWITNSTQS